MKRAIPLLALVCLLANAPGDVHASGWVLNGVRRPKLAEELEGVSCVKGSCVAVGISGQSPLILTSSQLVTGTWREGGRNVSAGQFEPHKVSCTKKSFCAAVGYDRNQNEPRHDVILMRSGSTKWKEVATAVSPGDASESLQDVSCVNPQFCVAVGVTPLLNGAYQPVIKMWNGVEWAFAENPTLPGSAALEHVSCATPDFCVSSGRSRPDSGIPRVLIEMWNGNQWSASVMPDQPQLYWFNGVSCSSPTDCIGVGGILQEDPVTLLKTSLPHAMRWDGSSWSPIPVPTADLGPGDAYFFSVSCAAPNQCVAVGVAENWTKSLIEVWDGVSWTRQEAPNPGTEVNYLYDVSCLADSRCTAVGGASDGLGSRAVVVSRRPR